MRQQKVTVPDVTEAVQEHADPVVATSEIAEVLGVSDPTARKWLKRARDAGRIGNKQLPSGVRVWYPPEAGQSMLGEYADGEPPDRPADAGEKEMRPGGGGVNPDVDLSSEVEEAVARALEPALNDIKSDHTETGQEMIQEARQGAREAVKELHDSEEPYSDVSSPSRWYGLKKRADFKEAMIQTALAFVGGFLLYAILTAFVPAGTSLPWLSVPAVTVAGYIMAGILFLFLLMTGVYVGLSTLLWLGVFKRAGQVFAAPSSSDDSAETEPK